jgi:hypothetical protein
LALGTDRVWAVTGGVNWWPRTNLPTVVELEYADFDDPILVGEDSITREWVIKILTQFEFWRGLYVFGDEFTGDSIDRVLRTVDRLNRLNRTGKRRLRIHAIGFPNIFSQARFGGERRRALRHAHARGHPSHPRGWRRAEQRRRRI